MSSWERRSVISFWISMRGSMTGLETRWGDNGWRVKSVNEQRRNGSREGRGGETLGLVSVSSQRCIRKCDAGCCHPV